MDSMLFRREITAVLATLPHDDTPEEHKIAFEAIREEVAAALGEEVEQYYNLSTCAT